MVRSIWSKLNPWIEGIAMSLGAFFPLALVAVAFQGRILMVLAYGVTLALICGSGAQVERFLRRRQWAGSAATAAALVVILVAAKHVIPRVGFTPGQRTMNEPAPRFTVAMLDGTPVTLDSLKGRVVVMDFWGTWCGPCLAEMPAIQKVHRTFASNSNVVFLAVNAGWHGDSADTVRSFVERRHLDVPVALDPDGATRQLKVDALPTLVLIDRQGRIRLEEAGFDMDEPLESNLTGQIQRLLQQ
jgi:thiol-disulfide isomerase/thioredoxin